MHEKWQASRGGRRVRTIITGLVTAVWVLMCSFWGLQTAAWSSSSSSKRTRWQSVGSYDWLSEPRLGIDSGCIGPPHFIVFYDLISTRHDHVQHQNEFYILVKVSAASEDHPPPSPPPLFLHGLQSESARVKDNPLKCRWRGHRIIFVYDSQKITSWLELNHTDSLIRNHRAGALFVFLLD